MTQLNHLSDNQIVLTSLSAEGSEVQMNPRTEWLKVYLRAGGRTFTAVNDGENSKNCHIDEQGKLVLDIPSRSLKQGILEYMTEIREDSQFFKDGYKNTFAKEYKPTGIEMV